MKLTQNLLNDMKAHAGNQNTVRVHSEVLKELIAKYEDSRRVTGALTGEEKEDHFKRLIVDTVGEETIQRTPAYASLSNYGNKANIPITDPKKFPIKGKANANILISKLENGNHAPCFDIDMPCKLIPSKSPGHYHLMIEKEISWEKYQILLQALVIAGIVEKGYVEASVNHGTTAIRVNPEEVFYDEIRKNILKDGMDFKMSDDEDSVMNVFQHVEENSKSPDLIF